MSEKFTHLDDQDRPQMVDVGAKAKTTRLARARSKIFLGKAVLEKLEGEGFSSPKGPVFQTAIIAGTMAAKKTGELIPLCHPLGLDGVSLDIRVGDREKGEVLIDCTATINAKTGVEMEALTGATVAALTIYDMCKALSTELIIGETVLIEKRGGKRDFNRDEESS